MTRKRMHKKVMLKSMLSCDNTYSETISYLKSMDSFTLRRKRGHTVISDLFLANCRFTPTPQTHSEAQRPRFYIFHAVCRQDEIILHFNQVSNYFLRCTIIPFQPCLYKSHFSCGRAICAPCHNCVLNELLSNKHGSNSKDLHIQPWRYN